MDMQGTLLSFFSQEFSSEERILYVPETTISSCEAWADSPSYLARDRCIAGRGRPRLARNHGIWQS
jgi:hypothetical protein